ncbi:hypothetical protein [Bacteroides sp. 519]|uniref:hypothetical protein n=1 Tax=Bacteroides sp. 519 TaxID=2302937 RepID=UPI0013D5B11A|nr:hypothetical protein [Bacteroides sp. 519]NDV60611.1 hypothetical protein [Bacteroides sp. 519]
MNKKQIIPIAAIVLLVTLALAACQAEEEGREEKNLPITIGRLNVACSEALHPSSRADEDGLADWYVGDELKVYYWDENGANISIGSYTRTAHGTWKAADNVWQVSDVSKDIDILVGKDFILSDQSTWQNYHKADRIVGFVTLDRTTGQVYTAEGQLLNHQSVDVVITLTPATTGWAPEEFEQHIRTAKISINGYDMFYNYNLMPHTPWLSRLSAEGAELRAHINPYYLAAAGDATKPIITITPGDGSAPISGSYTLPADTNLDPDGYNMRLAITFANYANQRILAPGTATIVGWQDGGTEEIVE